MNVKIIEKSPRFYIYTQQHEGDIWQITDAVSNRKRLCEVVDHLFNDRSYLEPSDLEAMNA